MNKETLEERRKVASTRFDEIEAEKTDLRNRFSELEQEQQRLQGEHRLIEELVAKLDKPSKKKETKSNE